MEYTPRVSTAASEPIRQDICPLCGGPNACGIAAGAPTCWCFAARIPAAVLERVPDDARDKSCICQACAAADVSTTTPPVTDAEIP
jgi:hypothetical protein